MNNAVKHSHAKAIQIRLLNGEGRIELAVEDDGSGMADGANGDSSGMGMQIMDYRARSIGGTLEIQDSVEGTNVCCKVPIRVGALAEETDALVG